ncbi:MAG: hypothetical protein ACYTG0_42490, partial [Planctomycetota bacterium]
MKKKKKKKRKARALLRKYGGDPLELAKACFRGELSEGERKRIWDCELNAVVFWLAIEQAAEETGMDADDFPCPESDDPRSIVKRRKKLLRKYGGDTVELAKACFRGELSRGEREQIWNCRGMNAFAVAEAAEETGGDLRH